ncbi:MAG: UTP--glucose-1-phosphate uridylyltransferase GalU [Planctomycetota bacterium]|jgi:UTP--glucose-1-phosphate uridylyltransferase
MIRKAVIPAAGFGTRFLPTTKAQPKEMLPIVDTPTIQFVVEEAVQSGITDILMVTGRGKSAIENHFDRTFELEAALQESGKSKQLKQVRHLAEMADIHYIRQRELRGLGDAVAHARHHVAGESFVLLLGDTVLDAPLPCTRQLIDIHNRLGGAVLAVEEVPEDKVDRYGIIAGEQVEENLWRVTDLVEKPARGEAPSRLAIAGRYVLPPEVFPAIDGLAPGALGELQITDAIRELVGQVPVHAFKFEGKRHDIGSRIDYLKCIVEFAVRRPDVGPEFREYLEEFVKREDE